MANGPFYPAGKYVCQILNQAIGETSTGKPQLILRFQVLGTPDPAEPGNYIPDAHQYERTWYRVLTENSAEYAAQDLKALGYTHGSFKFFDPATPGFQNMSGQIINMVCNHEDNQDKSAKREKWGLLRPAGEFLVKPLEPKKLRDLDNLFGKHLKGLKSNGSAAPPPPTPAASDMGITDDDIPF